MYALLARSARGSSVALRLLFSACTRAASMLAIGLILAGLAGAWACARATGDSLSSAPDLFYLPIILAAVRFSWAGAALAALAGGLLAGPAVPADMRICGEQPEGWLLQLGTFLVIGLFVAGVTRVRLTPLRTLTEDALYSARLVEAIRRGEIDVHFQPIYQLDDMRISGFEALARWTDPRIGPVAPSAFIPALERTGTIDMLDEHILRRALACTREWSDRFGPLTVSVNISATRFARPGLAAEIERLLGGCGLPAEALQIEITESAFIDDLEVASRHLQELRHVGVRVAIDDFGTGRASLAYLDQFEVDAIKLDRIFLVRATTDPRTRCLLEGVVRALRELQVAIVSEGVETDDQLNLVREVGANFGQGFLLGRPAPASQMEGLLSAARTAE